MWDQPYTAESGNAAADRSDRRSFAYTSKYRILPGLVLLAVLAVSFFFRAAAYDLPALSSWEKACFQDEDGEPYLAEMDSYFYLRKAREMAEQDRVSLAVDRKEDPLIGQRIRDSEEGVTLPLGLSALTFLVWKYLLSPFGVSLTRTALWMGPVLGSLAAVPAFCYVRRRSSLPGAAAAGLLVGCALPFMIHTHAGFYDTDMLLGILPLTAIMAQMRSMLASGRRNRIGWALLSAAAFAALSLVWKAYIGYVALAVLGTLLSLLFLQLMPASLRENAGRTARKGAAVSLLFSLAALFLLWGPDAFARILGAVREYISATRSEDSMPYALQFTAEMGKIPFFPPLPLLNLVKAKLPSVLGRLGGLIPCALALLYFPLELLLLRRENREPERQPAGEAAAFAVEAGFLGAWMVLGVYLASTAKRLAEPAVLPVGVLCGLTIGRGYILARQTKRPWRIPAAAVCLCVAFSAAFPTCYWGRKAAVDTRPLATDSMDKAMCFIRENTAEDTAIAAWWDYGYFWEYRSGRRTLADGGTDSGKVSFFLAHALMTDDPEQMRGILRMLNESGTDALDALTAAGMEQADAAALLLDILPMDRTEAEKALRGMDLPPGLLDMTHPEHPGPLLVTLSTDLLGKTSALAYFGFWDPAAKAQTEKTVMVCSSASAALADGTAELAMRDDNYSVTIFEDPDGHLRAEYTDHDSGPLPPCRFCVWEDGKLLQEEGEDNGGLAVIAVRENERYCAALCSGNICNSMLVRMLVCEDGGLECAERLNTWYGTSDSETSAAQQRINSGPAASRAVQVWQLLEAD